MPAPQRIQRQRTKGWKMPEGAVYVGRPTIYGNPFVADQSQDAVDAFRKLTRGGTQSWDIGVGGLNFAENRHRNSLHWAWAEWLQKEGLPAIRGKDLACWCPLTDPAGRPVPCHADVLLSLANHPGDLP